jgi:hypothetical protein
MPVSLTILNSRLGINLKDDFTMSSTPGDSNNIYSNSFPISLDKNVVQGTYDFTIIAQSGSDKVQKTVNLIVQECKTNTPAPVFDDSNKNDTVKTNTTTKPTTPVVVQPTQQETNQQTTTPIVVSAPEKFHVTG